MRLQWTVPPDDKLVAAAKAIFDETRASTEEVIESVMVRIVEVFREDIQEFLDSVSQEFDEKLAAVQRVHSEHLQQITDMLRSLPTTAVTLQPVLPPLPPAVVNNVVNVPKPRLTEKSFTYDEYGRPEKVREQEM